MIVTRTETQDAKISRTEDFQIGDKIKLEGGYSATCQDVEEKGATFLMDFPLYCGPTYMNDISTNDGGYGKSCLRNYLLKNPNPSILSIFKNVKDLMIPFEDSCCYGDLLRIPFVEEIFEKDLTYHPIFDVEILHEGKRWELMKDFRNRLTGGSAWLANKVEREDSLFCVLNRHGKLKFQEAGMLNMILLVFKIKLPDKEILVCDPRDQKL